MKEINLKKSVALYRQHEKDVSDFRHYLRLAQNSSSWEGKLRESESREKDSKALMEDEISCSISPILDEVQKRCKARTICAEDIVKALCFVEDELRISKKSMDGISVEIDLNAQPFPNAYKGIPDSTQFSARFKNGYWRVTDIRRAECRAPGRAYVINHTDESKAALIERFTYLL